MENRMGPLFSSLIEEQARGLVHQKDDEWGEIYLWFLG